MFAQYGRDKSKLPEMTASTLRYLVLTSVPLHFISAALAASVHYFLYAVISMHGAFAVVTLAPHLVHAKSIYHTYSYHAGAKERQSVVILEPRCLRAW